MSGVAEEGLRQEHAHLLAVVELLHQLVVTRVGDAELAESSCAASDSAFQPLRSRELTLELRRAHAVFVAEVGLGVEASFSTHDVRRAARGP
jgi:hypothetical protein